MRGNVRVDDLHDGRLGVGNYLMLIYEGMACDSGIQPAEAHNTNLILYVNTG